MVEWKRGRGWLGVAAIYENPTDSIYEAETGFWGEAMLLHNCTQFSSIVRPRPLAITMTLSMNYLVDPYMGAWATGEYSILKCQGSWGSQLTWRGWWGGGWGWWGWGWWWWGGWWGGWGGWGWRRRINGSSRVGVGGKLQLISQEAHSLVAWNWLESESDWGQIFWLGESESDLARSFD